MHTVTVCLASRVELRITSGELPAEVYLARVLVHTESITGRVEVPRLQGGSGPAKCHLHDNRVIREFAHAVATAYAPNGL
jgi:hypothetical protein